MVGKENRYVFWGKTHTEYIQPDQIPNSIDLSKVVELFSLHKYHLGNWSDVPTPTPNVKDTSHIVREVNLTDDKGLVVTFDFMHTSRGDIFMKEYYNHDDFKMIPILDENAESIIRFDFIRESNDEK